MGIQKHIRRFLKAQQAEHAHLLSEDAAEFALGGYWGLYRNCRFDVAEALANREKLAQALLVYLEVCYLDLNGPQNRGNLDRYPDLAAEYPPFDPADSLLPPGLVAICRDLVAVLELSHDDVRYQFFSVAEKSYRGLSLPQDPDTAWQRLSQNALPGKKPELEVE